jgi:hypothetical protein
LLRAARERRGVSITAIAEATKVCPSHFAALERGDLKHWPRGLFRRAFFRGYVSMIGLPIEEMLDEFVRLFPDDNAAPAAPARTSSTENPLRLTLDLSWHGPRPPIVSRLVSATIDAAAVLFVAGAAAWVSRLDVTTALAIAPVTYFTLATAIVGGSPAAWAIQRRSVVANIWQRSRSVNLITLFSPGAAEQIEDYRIGGERSWTTDAHRIRPRQVPPRIRVRFKLS